MGTEMGVNIKAVSERTGIPLHTLRAWERRYGVPRPNRDAENRYRLYDEQDIADVLWMKRQVEAGVSPARASALLRQQRTAEPGPTPALLPIVSLREALYRALERRDQAAAEQVLNQAWSAFAPEQVLLEIIQPTLHQIGDNWQRNALSVEQEHFASNLIRQRLHALIQMQPPPRPNAPRLIAACAPEEQHDLGLLSFTLLARRHGWDVHYLGQRTPLAELHRIARHTRGIVISVSTVTGLASLVPLWSAPLPAAPLLFGGDIFNLVPSLRTHMPGDYLGANGVDGVQQLETMRPHPPEWRPPHGEWHAAQRLDTMRLPIVAETVRGMMDYAAQLPHMDLHEYHAALEHAALFMTDAIVSALAFDAPELMDLQGAWVSSFLPAHAVPLAALYPFFDFYKAACASLLTPDAAERINALVRRLVASFAPAAGEPE